MKARNRLNGLIYLKAKSVLMLSDSSTEYPVAGRERQEKEKTIYLKSFRSLKFFS